MAVQEEPSWIGNLENTAFIFYQGRDASQLQACKYVGDHPIGASTGELATLTKNKGIAAIPREKLWVYPEIEEIDRHVKFGLLSRLKHWFTGLCVVRPTPNEQLDYTPLYPQDESGSLHHYSILNSKRSLGQVTDIQEHGKKYSRLLQYHENINNIILYGVSRGATTTFSALADNQYKNVKLCVIEAPPASIKALFKFYFSRFLGKILYNNWVTSLFIGKQHKIGKEHQAMAHVATFPNDVPLVIISSQKDKTVPHKNSIKLALAVAEKRIAAKEKGDEAAPVYFLQLDKSNHNNYGITSTSEDSVRYQNFIHAVYKIHGLPHIDEYAIQGEKELRSAELTNGILKNQVQFQAKFKKEKTARKTIRTEALNDIYSELTTLEPEEKKRTISICSAMPLYSKHRNSFALFGKTDTHKKLEALLEEPSFISTQYTC